MGGYKHNAEDAFEACLGKKREEVFLSDLSMQDWFRLVLLWNVIDFLEKLSEKDRFIVEVLFTDLGISRVSQLVEMVERVLISIAQVDYEEGVRIVNLFIDRMLQEVRKGGVVVAVQ